MRLFKTNDRVSSFGAAATVLAAVLLFVIAAESASGAQARDDIITFFFDLADALVGGDGSLPGTAPPGTIAQVPGSGQFLAIPALAVDGVFRPDSKAPTQIASTGLSFDFSPKIGIDAIAGKPANGPAGQIEDPSGKNGNPDYTGDPDHHALLEMHACVGVTFDLDNLRSIFQGKVTIERLTCYAGGSTPGTTSYWVLVDGVDRAYGVQVGIQVEQLDIPLVAGDRFLTLVVGDGNKGTINWAHGFFGDPFLTLSGEEATNPPSQPDPPDGSTDMLAWQPVSWEPQIGIDHYVVRWRKDLPGSPERVRSTKSTALFPDQYLEYGAPYRWQVTAYTVSGKVLSSPWWSFTTEPQGFTVPDPAYDISPLAQAHRRDGFMRQGIESLTGSGTPLSSRVRISFYGDSITDNTQYQAAIIQALKTSPNTSGLNVVTDNRGINGAKAIDLIWGTRRYGEGGGLHDPLEFKKHIGRDQPDVAVIFIGVNETNNYPPGQYPVDYVRYDSPPTTDLQFTQQMQFLVDWCALAGVRVVLATPAVNGEKPDGSNTFDHRLDSFADICRQIAQASSHVTLVDLRETFVDYLRNKNYQIEPDGSITHPASKGILTGDGIHFNAKGQAFAAELIADGIVKSLIPDWPRFETYGEGCPSSLGQVAEFFLPGEQGPLLGKPFLLDVSPVPSGSAVLMTLGLSRSEWQDYALPYDLMLFGYGGCGLLSDLALPASLVSSSSGVAHFSMRIPNQSALLGLEMFIQGFVLESPGGFVSSTRGARTVLGAQ